MLSLAISAIRFLHRRLWWALPGLVLRRWDRCFEERELLEIFREPAHPLRLGHLLGWEPLPKGGWDHGLES